MNEINNTDSLVAEALKQGFGDGGIISFLQFKEQLTAFAAKNQSFDKNSVLQRMQQIIPDCKKGSFLVCALPYAVGTEDKRVPPSPFEGSSPFMHIASFAARHYYKAAVEKMKILQNKLQNELGLTKNDFRIFCNSILPERWLAKAAGIGEFGKNNLIINEKYGTWFVIAVLFSKQGLPPSPIKQNTADPCKNCVKCIRACPVNALSAANGLDTTLCLQACATRLEEWSEGMKKIWGHRLYGCEICQQVCPHNQGIQQKSDAETGYLGEHISIEGFLKGTEDEIKTKLKGSALGMSWIRIQTLVRNALVAAGNAAAGTEELKRAILKYTNHPDNTVRDAALWALKKIL